MINMSKKDIFHEYSENFSLSSKQEEALYELLSPGCKTIKRVAEKIHVSERTIYNWLKNSEFRTILNKERKRLTEDYLDGLSNLLDKAIKTLDDLMNDKSSSIRLKASSCILDYNLKIRERKDIIEKLENIEDYITK